MTTTTPQPSPRFTVSAETSNALAAYAMIGLGVLSIFLGIVYLRTK